MVVRDITELSDDDVQPPAPSQASSKNAPGPVTPEKKKKVATPKEPTSKKAKVAKAKVTKPDDDAADVSDQNDHDPEEHAQDEEDELAEDFSDRPPPSLPTAKAKSKGTAKGKAKAKAKAKAVLKRPSASSAVMKRPASSQGDGNLRYWPDGRIRVQKGLYKNGVHGLKMGGHQVCLATQQH